MYAKIKSLCQEKNISVYQLERDLGLSNGSVCKWKTAIPRADSLQKVANYLEVSTEELLESYEC